ncbi:MAG: hypothetical protein G01um101448_119 [Parcubacteria group bacterium Gr01-1014_48]|nr:MAG: hypothetical protein Greene041614_41 [Parcubacteria group bacterium Greene0416_14]TSC74478.1 MAG: hypothetical protein G01um101448_119 [Parcubacteria group bacterium Gr01-1014_48]TSD01789.1 MAG: hypothetical protein Greene101415_47 [Parcubacteria group bacterium Greene1014_15]TSD08503.1 MAG: hypothetical protein Greene07144_42 [Parcubacteria group bacterium Greene0714_4]
MTKILLQIASFSSVSPHTSSKYAIFTTNFDHFATALDSGQVLNYHLILRNHAFE